MKHYGNVTKINGAEVEPVDIITFGAPCQDLSVAGKRMGLKHSAMGDDETTRSGLFFEAIRIIKEMRESTNGEYPKYAVYENVPGAFSSNKGRDFHAVLEALCSVCDDTVSIPEPYDKKRTKLVWAKAGEIVGDNYSIAWRTLDAQYWGVPQRRKRIYLVADFTGGCAGEILFKPESLRGDFTQGDETGEEVAADAVGSADGSVGVECIAVDGYNQTVSDICGSIRAGKADQDHVGCTVYSFDSLSSNSMKSSNPFSGCREVEVAKQAKSNGGHSISFINPVCYDARGNGDGETACTITGDHQNRITDYTAVAVQEAKGEKECAYGTKTETNTDKILQALWEEVGAKKVAEWGFRILISFQQKGVLRPCLHGKSVSDGGNGVNKVDSPAPNEPQEKAERELRGVRSEKCARCTPQRWKPSEQQLGEFTAHLQELSQQDSSAEGVLHHMWEANERAWLLRKALSEIQKAREPICNKNQPIQRRYIIRRLLPVECARLQGFPDWWSSLAPYDPADADFWEDVRKTHAEINGKKYKPVKDIKKWYDKLHTDSAEYKAYGNGLALPCAEFVIRGIAEVLRNEKGQFTSKGGVIEHKGYTCIYKPEHPRAKANGYVREHILVAEEMLGRPLDGEEVVHHINGDKADNRPENLEIFPTHAEHVRHHNRTDGKKYSYNGGEFTVAELSEFSVVDYSVLTQRINKLGWDIKRAVETPKRGQPTLGSLFDGIGGFPLAGVLNGIEPIWASEVECYPIAVTKSRFGGAK